VKPEGAPDTVRVGLFDYQFVWHEGTWSVGNQSYGTCDFTTLTIDLNGNLPRQRLASSFQHEVTHAGLDALGYCSSGEKAELSPEDVCIFNSKFWPMFWRNNPEALKWWLSLLAKEDVDAHKP